MASGNADSKPSMQNVFQAQADNAPGDFILPEFAEIQIEEEDATILKSYRGGESNRQSSQRKKRKTWQKRSEIESLDAENVHDHYLLSFNKKAHQRVDSKV